MNKVILMGRLVRDPEVRYTASSKCVAKITLAVDRPVSGSEKQTDFIDVIFWNKTAETVGNHVTKGQRLLVEGRLQIRQYDAKDGSKRYATEVIANAMEFIEKKGEAQQGNFATMGEAKSFSAEIPF